MWKPFVKYLPTIRPPRKASPAPVVSTILLTFGGLVHTTCYSMFNSLTRCSSHSHVNLLMLITIVTSYINTFTLCIGRLLMLSNISFSSYNNYIHYCYHSYSKLTYYVWDTNWQTPYDNKLIHYQPNSVVTKDIIQSQGWPYLLFPLIHFVAHIIRCSNNATSSTISYSYHFWTTLLH